MANMLHILKKASEQVDRVAAWISILYTFLVTVVVLGSVFLRMAGRAPSWSEEFARWMLVGIAFVSSSIALKRGAHIGITALVKNLPIQWITRIIILISNILALFFLACVFWFGLDAAIKAVDQTGDIIPISVIFIKMHIPLGALMMIVHLFYYTFGAMTHGDAREFLMSQ